MPGDRPTTSQQTARTAFLAVAGLAVLASAALFGLRSDDPARSADLVASADFLAGLRDQPDGDGCIALQSMARVETLVIGSSHAGAGVDPLILAEALPDQRIAVCAVPAWTLGHFDLLFEFLRAEDLTPERLIWIADLGVVVDLPQSEQSLALARQIFGSKTLQRQTRDRWRRHLERSGAPFQVDLELRSERLARQRRAIAQIEPATLAAIHDAQTPADLVRLGRALEGAPARPRVEERLAQLCAQAGTRFGRLDVVISPTPELTQSYLINLEETDLPPSQSAFAARLAHALPCAASLRSRRLGEWGLDARHYINRSGALDYPYEIWASPEAFVEQTQDMSLRERRRLYDSNHLNPVGAQIFTRALVDALSQDEPSP